jgi:hypothetical protein
MKKIRKLLLPALCSLLLCHTLLFPTLGECQESADMVEIEYGGKIIHVDMADLILISDGRGGQTFELDDPEK